MADAQKYRQTAIVYAEQLTEPYSAYSGRGLVQGNNGDYLCYREGAEQDKYTLERAAFESTHEKLPDAEQPGATTAADTGTTTTTAAPEGPVMLAPAEGQAPASEPPTTSGPTVTTGAASTGTQTPTTDTSSTSSSTPTDVTGSPVTEETTGAAGQPSAGPVVTEETPGIGAAGEVAPDAGTTSGSVPAGTGGGAS